MNRREFLVGSGAVLGASAVRPTVAGAQAQPPRGHIIAGLSERMLTLDPANHYSISATSVLRHVYDPLLDVTNDDKFVPALAETWRPVNNTTWRFTLRKGVTFHDGTPVQRRQRGVHAQAGAGRQADQVVRLPGHRGRPEGRRLRGHGDDASGRSARCRPT